MSEIDLTVDTIKLALRGLDEGFGGRPELTPDEQERFLHGVASAALDAFVVACKFLLGMHGRLAVPGLGTLAASVQSPGKIELVPEPDTAQYLAGNVTALRDTPGTAHLIWAYVRLGAEMLEAHPHLRKEAVPESRTLPGGFDLASAKSEVEPPSLEKALREQILRIEKALGESTDEDEDRPIVILEDDGSFRARTKRADRLSDAIERGRKAYRQATEDVRARDEQS